MRTNEKQTLKQPEKMNRASMDVAQEKREQLKACFGDAFPEVFAEGAIDFDQLRRVLGDWIDPGKERFGLNWPGKAECMRIIQQPSIGALKPVREESVNFDETQNIFIEGDNLEVLKLLQKSYFGKIKLIYIDPPYNTGKEFIYPDKFSESLETYLAYTGQVNAEGKKFSTNTETSGRFHSRWLNMMYPRLYLARNLLREDGAIVISIDDHELINLTSICDHIFGEENHVATISVLNNLKGRNDKKNVAACHEYLVIYGNEKFESYGIPLTAEQLAQYKHKDEHGNAYALRDLRKRGGAPRRADRPNMYFPIYFNQSEGICALERKSEEDIAILPLLSDGSDGRWRWGKVKVRANLNMLHPKYNRSKDRWTIEHRVYLDPSVAAGLEADDEADDKDRDFERTSKSKSFWWGADISTDHAVRSFKELFDGMGTDYPKSPKFLKRILYMCTKCDDIVLDFFAGFGTTAHAVMAINLEDGGNRRFIMVQLPEVCSEDSEASKAGYSTISELSRERIRRAGASLIEHHQSQLSLEDGSLPDTGFKALTLSASNFKVWAGRVEEEVALVEQLSMHVEHIDPNSDADSILFELLLKAGFPLETKIEKSKLAHKTVYSVHEGALLICLEKELTFELIDALAEANPLQVICLDEGFKGNDQLKANAVQTFKARAQAEESEIVFRTV